MPVPGEEGWEQALVSRVVLDHFEVLLWEVSRNGKVLGHLFGTYHLSFGDDRFERPMTLARAALAGSKAVAFELDLAEPGLSEAIGQVMAAPNGPYLDRLLGAELFDQVLPLLESRGIPRSAARFLKPWVVGTILAFPEAQEGPMMD